MRNPVVQFFWSSRSDGYFMQNVNHDLHYKTYAALMALALRMAQEMKRRDSNVTRVITTCLLCRCFSLLVFVNLKNVLFQKLSELAMNKNPLLKYYNPDCPLLPKNVNSWRTSRSDARSFGMITGAREPRAVKHRTDKTKTRPVPNGHNSPLQKMKMKENSASGAKTAKRKLFEHDQAINDTPDWRASGLQVRGGKEQKSNSASRSIFEGASGSSGIRDQDNFSRLLFHIVPSSERSPFSESRKELALKSSVKRAQRSEPSEPSRNTKYPRKFLPMASSTPEKKEKKKELTFIRTTWTLRKPGNGVKSDWSTKPDKNQQIDLNLCWIPSEGEEDGGQDDGMYF